jgi:cobalt-zinc-cadmium efflux system protein
VLVVYFVYEGVHRLIDPPEVEGRLVAITAAFGIVVNVGATWLLSRANRQSLNVEGAYHHILNDLFAFIATLVAGLVIVFTGFRQSDAIAALVVAVLMARAGYGLLRDSTRILLEAAPKGVDPAASEAALLALPGVTDVHELHVWEVTSGFPALSAHVLVDNSQDCHQKRGIVEQVLGEQFHIAHTTLQVDHRDNVVNASMLTSRLHPTREPAPRKQHSRRALNRDSAPTEAGPSTIPGRDHSEKGPSHDHRSQQSHRRRAER